MYEHIGRYCIEHTHYMDKYTCTFVWQLIETKQSRYKLLQMYFRVSEHYAKGEPSLWHLMFADNVFIITNLCPVTLWYVWTNSDTMVIQCQFNRLNNYLKKLNCIRHNWLPMLLDRPQWTPHGRLDVLTQFLYNVLCYSTWIQTLNCTTALKQTIYDWCELDWFIIVMTDWW